MPEFTDTLTRAFELAESGEYPSVNHIRQQLRREDRGDVYEQLSGSKINRDLIAILQRTASAPSLVPRRLR